MKPFALVLYSILLFLPSVIAAVASCYFPDGTLKASDIPSNFTSSTGHSSCCGPAAEYLSSGLCLITGLVARGSCTDPTWADSACPNYCRDVNPSGGIPIVPNAYGGAVNVAQWCCDWPLSNGSCAQGFEIKVDAGTVMHSPSTSTVSSIMSSTAFVTTTAAATGVVSSGTAEGKSEPQCVANHDVAIGTGMGIPLVMALCVALGLWWMERRRRIKQRTVDGHLEQQDWGQRWEAKTEVGSSNHTIREMDGRPVPGEMP